jgi:4-diphosphocytidyl-2-C-methyl-D-erythritol kinase
LKDATPAMIVETAPAKFNRFLAVLGQRRDGFHTLELITTVLPWPSIFDELTAEASQEWALEIDGPAAGGLFADDSNLVARAWRLLERESGRPLPAKLRLHKRIPLGAGLGGGSSDAAAALRAGNALHRLGLSNSALLRMAAELGSDVPLFLLGGTVLGLDLGQRVLPLRDMPLPPMLIAYPGLHVSTASVYKAMGQNDLSNNAPCPAPCPSLGADEAPPWRNDLTDAAISVCPELRHVRDALKDAGGYPLLCGSGSCWAARFSSQADRDAALRRLSHDHPEWQFYAE